MTELTVTERYDLIGYENVIKKGLKTFIDVGNALMAIREGRLYRAEYATFEEYCDNKWGFTDRRARQLIGAAQVAGNIGTVVPEIPTSESVLRPLVGMEPTAQREVYQRAATTAPNGRVTAAHVEATKREYQAAVPSITALDSDLAAMDEEIATIVAPEPVLNPGRSRPLTDEEAAAVVWRVIERHCDTRNLMPHRAAQAQRAWLAASDWDLYRKALTDGVRFANGQLLATINAVKAELEQRIARLTAGVANPPRPAPAIAEPEPGPVGEEPEAEEEKADSDEWYTPRYVIDAARKVLGKIDLDPASCADAQQVVRAMAYASKANDSLRERYPWLGRIWLNPPYSNPLPWVEKLFQQYEAGNVRAALLLVNTTNSPQWARLLWQSDHRVCLLSRRIKFWRPDRPDGKGFDRDQMIWYLGKEPQSFADVFSEWGAIR